MDNLFCDTSLIINFIANIPEIAATIIPKIMGSHTEESIPCDRALGNSKTADPKMEGIDIKNANFTANSLFKPAIRPPNKVDPDLDTPGAIATPCIMPTNTEVLYFIFPAFVLPPPIFSAIKRTVPVNISPNPIATNEP